MGTTTEPYEAGHPGYTPFILPEGLRADIDNIDLLDVLRTGSVTEAEAADARLTYGSPEFYAQVQAEAISDLKASTTVYCGDIESVLATPEYGLPESAARRSYSYVRPHESSNKDFRSWLSVLKRHMPEATNDALGQVIRSVVDFYNSEAFRATTRFRGSANPRHAKYLEGDARDLLDTIVYDVLNYGSDPELGRSLIETDFFADYSDSIHRLQVLQYIASLAGVGGEYGLTGDEYKEMKRKAAWYIGSIQPKMYALPPVDYRLLAQREPGMLSAIAKRHATKPPNSDTLSRNAEQRIATRRGRASIVGALGAKALLSIPAAERTSKQAAELSALESYIVNPNTYARQLKARLQKEGPASANDVAELKRRVRQAIAMTKAGELVTLAMVLLPEGQLEQLIEETPDILQVPQAGAIAVRRLARQRTWAARLVARDLEILEPNSCSVLHNLLAIYEEGGDVRAVKEAEIRLAQQYIGRIPINDEDTAEYLTRLYMAARKQHDDTRVADALRRLRPYLEDPRGSARYRVLRQMMQAHITLDDRVAAVSYAARIHEDQQFTAVQRLEAVQYLSVEYAQAGDLRKAGWLLERYLPTDGRRTRVLLDWVRLLAGKTYPALPYMERVGWEVELNPLRSYRMYMQKA